MRKGLIFVLVALTLMLSIVTAGIWNGLIEVNTGWALTTTNSQTTKLGIKVTPLADGILNNASLFAGSNASNWYLGTTLGGSEVATGTFSGGIATIEEALVNGTDYFLTADALGGGYDRGRTTGDSVNLLTLTNVTAVSTGDDLSNIGAITFTRGGIIILNSPNGIVPSSPVTFSCTATQTDSATIANMSLYTNQSGTFQLENVTTGLSLSTETVTWENVISEGEHVWNCQACDSDGDCGFASQNNSVEIDLTPPVINITAPISPVAFQESGTNFTINWTVTDKNLESCWYNYNVTTNVTVACSANTTQFVVTSSTNRNLTFYANDTVGLESSEFFSWNYTLFVNSQTFSPTTTEGQIESFILNITTASSVIITSAKLNYNNSLFTASINQLSPTDWIIDRDLLIPDVSGLVNNTFFWSLVVDGSELNTSQNNQTVNNLAIDDCSVFTNLILNYTLRDEDSQELISVPSNATIKLDVNIFPVGSLTPLIQLSRDYNETNTALVCLESPLGNSVFTMNVQAQYTLDDHTTEFHNLVAFSLTNTTIPQTIPLLDLLTSRAQNFLITVKGSDFLPLSGAIVDVTRKYVADGIFRSVEVPLTDTAGQASVSLVENSEIYTFIVSKDGVTIATFNDVVAVCQNVITGQCNIFLNAFTTGTDLEDFENFNGVSFNEVFDRATRTLTITFTTNDGSNALMFINTTKFDRFGNNTVCTDTLLSSSGTLTCVIPESFGNVTVQSQIFKDGSLISNNFYNLADGAAAFGTNGIIMALIMIITLPLMFISSPIGIVIGAIIGVIMSGSLLLYTGGSFFGAASTITWLVVAGLILLWRMAKGGES